MNALVKDVMTTQVVAVRHDTPFTGIAAALRQFRVGAFPVLDDDGLVIGVVSESDLLTKQALGGGEDEMPGRITGLLRQHDMEKARATTAETLMTAPPIIIGPDETVEHAARLMYLRRVKHLPVVDEAGQLTGIVEQDRRARGLRPSRRRDRRGHQEGHLLHRDPGRSRDLRRVGQQRHRHPGRQAANLRAGPATSSAAPGTCRVSSRSVTASTTRPPVPTPLTSWPASRSTDRGRFPGSWSCA